MILYSTGCPRCKVLEEKLKQKQINFEINNNTEEMFKLNITNVPVLKIEYKLLDFVDAVKYVNSLEVHNENWY